MSKSIQDYLNLVTSEYTNQPNFQATVSFTVAVQVQVQTLLDAMIQLFDIDNPPVGNQLDIIGQWVGISRDVSVPITGVYFTWDDTKFDGWDFGTWQPVPATASVTVLPDDVYLNIIRAKIASNNWNGTTEGAYAIWAAAFPEFTILIQDYCNMSYDIAITGGIVDSLTLALISGGYIQLRPEGIEINRYLVSTDSNKAFAWDVSNAYMAGWDTGSWLRST